MKKIKFNLSNIEGKLSRVEMQQIVGGSGYSFYCDRSIPEASCRSSRKGIRSWDGVYICCYNRDVRLSQ